MRKTLKFLHTIGAIGLTGGFAVYLILLATAPAMSELEAYHAVRVGIDKTARWLLLPSLTLVLSSGLLSLGAHAPFREQRWVWAKVLLGLSMFEGTLVSVQGPAQQAAVLTAKALAGEIDPARLPDLIHNEWGALWVVLTLAVVNVALAIWRPRLKSRAPARRSA